MDFYYYRFASNVTFPNCYLISADSITIALCFLFVSLVLYLKSDLVEKINIKQLLLLFILGIFITLSKEIYILDYSFFFLIPVSKFEK